MYKKCWKWLLNPKFYWFECGRGVEGWQGFYIGLSNEEMGCVLIPPVRHLPKVIPYTFNLPVDVVDGLRRKRRKKSWRPKRRKFQMECRWKHGKWECVNKTKTNFMLSQSHKTMFILSGYDLLYYFYVAYKWGTGRRKYRRMKQNRWKKNVWKLSVKAKEESLNWIKYVLIDIFQPNTYEYTTSPNHHTSSHILL